jgi:hypothetical protein
LVLQHSDIEQVNNYILIWHCTWVNYTI